MEKQLNWFFRNIGAVLEKFLPLAEHFVESRDFILLVDDLLHFIYCFTAKLYYIYYIHILYNIIYFTLYKYYIRIISIVICMFVTCLFVH